MGEREPFDNPEPTHGICAYHTAQFLESLPSRSFPDAALLIVVRRDDTALYEHLERSFAAMSNVKVIVERRVSDRRAARGQGSGERRYVRTRRLQEGTSSPLGDFTIMRFTPKEPPTAARSELDQSASTLGRAGSLSGNLQQLSRGLPAAHRGARGPWFLDIRATPAENGDPGPGPAGRPIVLWLPDPPEPSDVD